MFPGQKSSELLGVRSQNSERLPGLDGDDSAELISVATRKDWEAFEVVDFGESLGGVFIRSFYPEDVAFDKR